MIRSPAALAAVPESCPADEGAITLATSRHAPVGSVVPAPVPALVRWLLPTPGDIVFVVLAVMIPVAFGKQLLNSDGDLARQIANGSAILRGGLFYSDPFSYTRPGVPFTHFEWLSSILFAGVYRVGGLAGITAMAALLLAATYTLLYTVLRRRGVDAVLAVGVVMAAALLGKVHWLARPHLFTILGTVAVVALLERKRRPPPYVYLPLFAVWANLHGGFVYGLLLIFAYVAGAAVEWLTDPANRSAAAAALRSYGAALGLGFVGSLVTPNGLSSIGAVTRHMGETYLLDTTVEFMSPDFHHASGKPFLAILLLIVFALAVRPRRPAYGRLFLVLGTAALALFARRNIPLFGLSALPVVAIELSRDWSRISSRLLARVRASLEHGESAARGGVWAALTVLGLSTLGMNHGKVAGEPVLSDRFDSATFPVEAVRVARAARLQGRLFNAFTWGGYITYAWPEQKVFIDGQTAFFGEPMMREFMSMVAVQPGWRESLDRWGISVVMLPTSSALISELSRDPVWSRWYRDSTATILVRRTGARASAPPSAVPR